MEKIVQTAGRNALGEFAPEFAHFNDDVLFGENWNNQDIDVKTRSIITVVALMASGITDSSLRYHLQNAKNHGVTQKEIAAVITHAAWEYIHANRPAKSPGVLENPPQPNKFYPISTQGDYTPQKSSGNMSSSSSKSMVSSSDTSTHSMFSFPLIAHEYISAAARLENTSCIGSPFSNQ